MIDLIRVREIVAADMEDIQRLFKPGAKITVLLRSPGYPDRDFMMTDDNHDDIIAMVARCKAREFGAGSAIADIAYERSRQMTSEGFDTAHDDQHRDKELARAAASYAVFAAEPERFTALSQWMRSIIPSLWPWAAEWWKPSTDTRRNLVKAGALMVAEIERLDRAAAKGKVAR